ncbi:MAG: hypothetical protein ACTTHI_05225 [Prevotella sp.]
MKNFDCIAPNKEHLLICLLLCLTTGLYADEKKDSIKTKEPSAVSDSVVRSIQYPTNELILPGVVVYGKYPKMKIKPFKNKMEQELALSPSSGFNPLGFIFWMLKLIPQKHKKMETAKEKNQRILSEWDKYIAPVKKKE